jgi:hypothetical protein
LLRSRGKVDTVITGEDFSEAVSRSGLTVAQVAAHLGSSERTVTNWEKLGVPERREPFVRDRMGRWLTESLDLATVTDADLLLEVLRRLPEMHRRMGGGVAVAEAPVETSGGGHQHLQGKKDGLDIDDPDIALRARWGLGVSRGITPSDHH